MKKIFALIAFFSLLPLSALAIDMPVPPVPGMEWLSSLVQTVLGFVMGIPSVGPILAAVFMGVALVSSVMTVLAASVQAFLALPEVVARWKGATALAEKIKAVSDKVLPWLKYFSMFNVQKKP